MKTTFWIILMILGVALTLSLILYFKDGSDGKHVRFAYGIMERNIPKDHPDSLFIPKHDTTYIPQLVYINSKNKSKWKSDTLINNQSTVSGNGNHVVTGNGNQIGVNGDVHFEPQERHASTQLIQGLLQLNSNNLPIEVRYYTNTLECSTFANELISGLKANRATVKFIAISAMAGITNPEKTDFYYTKTDSVFYISVFPLGVVKKD